MRPLEIKSQSWISVEYGLKVVESGTICDIELKLRVVDKTVEFGTNTVEAFGNQVATLDILRVERS